jgi:hypothetical protein
MPSTIIDVNNIIIEMIMVFVVVYERNFLILKVSIMIDAIHINSLNTVKIGIIIDTISNIILINSNGLFNVIFLLSCLFFISITPIIYSIIKFTKKSHKLS